MEYIEQMVLSVMSSFFFFEKTL